MMKNIIYLLVFFISLTVFSQQKAIEITNNKKGSVIIFPENQRIKIRSLDGKKYIGNLKNTDSRTLLVDNHSVKIDSLQSIKRQPRTLGTVKTIVLATGLTIVGSSLVAASTGNESALMLLTIGTGTTMSAGLLESIYPNNTNDKWTFKIIEK